MNIKYYESKMNLNWKPILKSITDVRTCASCWLTAAIDLEHASHKTRFPYLTSIFSEDVRGRGNYL